MAALRLIRPTNNATLNKFHYFLDSIRNSAGYIPPAPAMARCFHLRLRPAPVATSIADTLPVGGQNASAFYRYPPRYRLRRADNKVKPEGSRIVALMAIG